MVQSLILQGIAVLMVPQVPALPRGTLPLNQAHGEEPVIAESLMRSPDTVLNTALSLTEALAKLMGSGGMSIGVVVEHDRPIGILTRHAALRALVRG